MIGTLETIDKASRMNTHSIVGSVSCSLAKEYKPLCDEDERVNGVKRHRKHKKREHKLKFKKDVITYKIRMMLR